MIAYIQMVHAMICNDVLHNEWCGTIGFDERTWHPSMFQAKGIYYTPISRISEWNIITHPIPWSLSFCISKVMGLIKSNHKMGQMGIQSAHHLKIQESIKGNVKNININDPHRR